jgi:hypothetical protein
LLDDLPVASLSPSGRSSVLTGLAVTIFTDAAFAEACTTGSGTRITSFEGAGDGDSAFASLCSFSIIGDTGRGGAEDWNVRELENIADALNY